MNEPTVDRPRGDRWIFGAGYLGLRVAETWLSQGYATHIVTRSPDKARRWAEQGFVTHVADIRKDGDLPWNADIDAVLWAVGFDRTVGTTIEQVQVDGLRHVLSSLSRAGHKARIWVQISTTGVYGDCAGDWVDESTPCSPQRASGVAALEAERLVAESPVIEASVALRLAGIYGPNRVPNLQQLRNRQPIEADPTGWLNLIHVADPVGAIEAAVTHPVGKRAATYVISDGNPVVRRAYYNCVAERFELPSPIFEPPAIGSSKAARGMGSKRANSQLFWQTYNAQPLYPTYEQGLAASY